MSDKIITYKGTDKDMKCRGYQYELGKTEKTDGAIRCGGKGFHSCEAPLDVLRYYPPINGNRYFVAEVDGKIDRDADGDSKIASSEMCLKAEVGLKGLISAHFEYTRKKAESGTKGGDWSTLAGGDWSTLVGGDRSTLAGGDGSTLAGGDWSTLAGGDWSTLVGGDGSNLVGGDRSTLAGGDSTLIVGRNGCKVKGGKNSVLVLTEWALGDGECIPVCVKSVIVDGTVIKADTWYRLENGELVEVDEPDENN